MYTESEMRDLMRYTIKLQMYDETRCAIGSPPEYGNYSYEINLIGRLLEQQLVQYLKISSSHHTADQKAFGKTRELLLAWYFGHDVLLYKLTNE